MAAVGGTIVASIAGMAVSTSEGVASSDTGVLDFAEGWQEIMLNTIAGMVNILSKVL